MTDEFNLVPTNNLEKHLDNILRAASGEEPQYDLAPNWRIEQYLAAISAKLSEGGSGGGVDVEIVKCVSGSPNTCDHTYAQLKSAYEAGKVLYCEATKSDNKYCGWLSWEENQYVGIFWMYVRAAGSSQQTKVAIGKDDSVTISTT